MSGLLSRFFGRETEVSTSKNTAKERLRLVLVHDRLDVSEGVMEQLREDLIATIGRYMDIDREALEVSLSREDGGVALVANIPVKGMKRGGEQAKTGSAPAREAEAAAQAPARPAAATPAPRPAAVTPAPNPAQAMLRAAQNAAQSAAKPAPSAPAQVASKEVPPQK
ncbi:MAG: cell division topological specificity factor MinE [Firmicutes bacterium]|nr:cell division topological specificity factor MinE [Bacillota bacterium]